MEKHPYKSPWTKFDIIKDEAEHKSVFIQLKCSLRDTRETLPQFRWRACRAFAGICRSVDTASRRIHPEIALSVADRLYHKIDESQKFAELFGAVVGRPDHVAAILDSIQEASGLYMQENYDDLPPTWKNPPPIPQELNRSQTQSSVFQHVYGDNWSGRWDYSDKTSFRNGGESSGLETIVPD